jgi:hypothetical protein
MYVGETLDNLWAKQRMGSIALQHPHRFLRWRRDDDAKMHALRQTFVLTAAMVAAVDQSVKQVTTISLA